MNIEQEREAFEKWWYASKYMQVISSSDQQKQIAWDAWQASAALQSVMPVSVPDGWMDAD